MRVLNEQVIADNLALIEHNRELGRELAQVKREVAGSNAN